MKLYLLRHEKRDLDNPRFNSPLLKEGLKNADKLKYKLDELDIDVIFVSPFKRVLQTITPFYLYKNGTITVNREFGLYEFIESDHNFDEENYHHDLSINDEEYNILNKYYESVVKLKEIKIDQDIRMRVNKFINELIYKYQNSNKNILLVTHMSIINCILNKKDLMDYFPMGGLCEIKDLSTREYNLF